MKRRSFLKLAGVATAVSSSLTCAPVFARSAKMKPGMTTFMPENGQIHGVGKPSKSINIDYIKTWTVSWRKKAGSLIKTTPTQLPSGKYLATLQLWHQTSAGKYLGELRCWKDGQQIASKAIYSESFGDKTTGGYQRCQMDFDLHDDSRDIQVEFWYAANKYVWTGAVNITPHDERRPFYIIGHRCSHQEKANELVEKGANAIEFDITPELVNGNIEFNVKHSGDLKWTRWGDFNDYLKNLKRHLDAQRIALIMLDTKLADGIDAKAYARALAERLISVGIDPKLAVMSVPAAVSKQFREVLGYHGDFAAFYPCGLDSYLEDYGDLTEQQWVKQAEATGASFLGVGAAAQFFWSPMKDWMSWIQVMTNRRDSHGSFKKAYFWTTNRKTSMRKALDYGVDGMITDDPDDLFAIVQEGPYKRMLRLATQNDSQFKVHGFGE